MDFCPECGGMIVNGTKCHLCGHDINGFDFRNLKIGVPKKFISDKTKFKNNYSALLDLILNKNQIYFTKEDILENYGKIIDVANENWINKEKKINETISKKQINEGFEILRTNYGNMDSEISREALLKLKLNYQNMDWDIIVQNYNRQFHKKKFESHKTTDDVYYLHDYIIKDNWKYSTPDKVRISKQILNYKNGINKDVVHFTNELICFIVKFVEYELKSNIKKIFLVSIPSSTQARDKNSPMKKTISIIVDKSKKNLINMTNHHEIINLSDLLYRKRDITASHIKRQSYETHMKTIGLNKNILNDIDDAVFIIMDDITTSGNIMDACNDILIKNGINQEMIYKIVIAATG